MKIILSSVPDVGQERALACRTNAPGFLRWMERGDHPLRRVEVGHAG